MGEWDCSKGREMWERGTVAGWSGGPQLIRTLQVILLNRIIVRSGC